MAPKKGDKAPDFSMPSTQGKTVSLKDLAGKKFVLYFYPKDDTPGCTKQACNIRDNYAALQKTGVQLFGVSADDIDSHHKFIQKFNLPFPLLYDKGAEVAKQYGSYGEKEFSGRKYTMILRNTYLIDEKGHLAEMWQDVRPENQTDDLMKVLQPVK